MRQKEQLGNCYNIQVGQDGSLKWHGSGNWKKVKRTNDRNIQDMMNELRW